MGSWQGSFLDMDKGWQQYISLLYKSLMVDNKYVVSSELIGELLLNKMREKMALRK